MASDALIGTYYHNIDVKGRMNFPTKLREVLGDSFFITKGLDNCLTVYSKESWEVLMKKVSELPISKGRNVSRFLCSGATEVVSDKQGRILIPQPLRDFAGFDKDVVVIGAFDRAEIWDRENWDRQNSEFAQESLESVMDDLGF
ncbi:MAG: division/cell wall cluster transcriptional repressor MraZ [Clostridiales bacterium]|nr:division/cell wall cluster transcriptional repressor MraZ [Clostridiales bacterium]